jgi:phosphoesterase RecJ-like protein
MIWHMLDVQQQIIQSLAAASRVLITSHVRPDGDAIGCCAAMAMALRARGVASETLLLSALPEKYAFALTENGLVHHIVTGSWSHIPPAARFDTLLVLDTGTWSQLPGLRQYLGDWGGRRIVIDHHLTQDQLADLSLIDSSAAAAGEIVADLIERWEIPLEPAIAEALYLAVASDTGWFAFGNTRPATLRLAARLLQAGADAARLYRAIYQSERASRLVLMKHALESLQMLAEGRLAVMSLGTWDFRTAGADMTDTENLINVPLQVGTVLVSMFVVEPPESSSIRVSLRSKGTVDVARFAQRFGGGGHAQAAGLKLEGTLASVRNAVVQAMLEELGPRG